MTDGKGSAASEGHGPQDHEITFFMYTYRDYDLGRECLRRLRAHYPEARLIVRSDGHHEPRYSALARGLRFDYREGPRLFGVECGGALVQAMLDAYLDEPTAWLIRIDTDSRVHRRLRWLPEEDCVFGTLEHFSQVSREALDPPNVQGGCLGLTLGAARALRASRVFEDPALLDPRSTWAVCRDIVLRAESGLVSFDFLVRYGCMRVGVPVREHPEVRSVWRGNVDNRDSKYAITHPHKFVRFAP
jgi:hypothetical protein